MVHTLNVDVNLREIGNEMVNLLSHKGYNYVSLRRNNIVEGRSWEMAAAMSLFDEMGVYSGTVESVSDSKIEFGPVPGVPIKRLLYNKLKTSTEVTFLSISR